MKFVRQGQIKNTPYHSYRFIGLHGNEKLYEETFDEEKYNKDKKHYNERQVIIENKTTIDKNIQYESIIDLTPEPVITYSVQPIYENNKLLVKASNGNVTNIQWTYDLIKWQIKDNVLAFRELNRETSELYDRYYNLENNEAIQSRKVLLENRDRNPDPDPEEESGGNDNDVMYRPFNLFYFKSTSEHNYITYGSTSAFPGQTTNATTGNNQGPELKYESYFDHIFFHRYFETFGTRYPWPLCAAAWGNDFDAFLANKDIIDNSSLTTFQSRDADLYYEFTLLPEPAIFNPLFSDIPRTFFYDFRLSNLTNFEFHSIKTLVELDLNSITFIATSATERNGPYTNYYAFSGGYIDSDKLIIRTIIPAFNEEHSEYSNVTINVNNQPLTDIKTLSGSSLIKSTGPWQQFAYDVLETNASELTSFLNYSIEFDHDTNNVYKNIRNTTMNYTGRVQNIILGNSLSGDCYRFTCDNKNTAFLTSKPVNGQQEQLEFLTEEANPDRPDLPISVKRDPRAALNPRTGFTKFMPEALDTAPTAPFNQDYITSLLTTIVPADSSLAMYVRKSDDKPFVRRIGATNNMLPKAGYPPTGGQTLADLGIDNYYADDNAMVLDPIPYLGNPRLGQETPGSRYPYPSYLDTQSTDLKRNPNFFFNEPDITCISMKTWGLEANHLHSFVTPIVALLSPRHGIMAQHVRNDYNRASFLGRTCSFMNLSSDVQTMTVDDFVDIDNTDLSILHFSEDVTLTDIKFAKFLPENFVDNKDSLTISYPYQMKLLGCSPTKEGTFTIENLDLASPGLAVYTPEPDQLNYNFSRLTDYFENDRTGDSSSPIFAYVGKELVLLGCTYTHYKNLPYGNGKHSEYVNLSANKMRNGIQGQGDDIFCLKVAQDRIKSAMDQLSEDNGTAKYELSRLDNPPVIKT